MSSGISALITGTLLGGAARADCAAIVNDIDLEVPVTDTTPGYYAAFTVGDSPHGESDFAAAWSITGVGDYDGDGNNDFLVGHPDHDLRGVADQGLVFLVFGPIAPGRYMLNDLDPDNPGLPGYQLSGPPEEGAFTGSSVAAGDFNHDGWVDLAIGASGLDDARAGLPDVGRSYIIEGDASGFSGRYVSIPAWAGRFLAGETSHALLGSAMAVGNLDDDDDDELLVGSPGVWPMSTGAAYTSTDYGKAYIFDGETMPTPTVSFVGENENAEAGTAVAAGGDFNGGGCQDILIGGRHTHDYDGDGTGAAYLVYGPRAYWEGESCAGFDRYPESYVTTGYPRAPTIEGVLLSSVGHTIPGITFYGDDSTASAKAGHGVAFAGDVNADGYDDILIGSYDFDYAGGYENIGAVYLMLGGSWWAAGDVDLGTDYNVMFTGFGYHEKAGIHVAGVGDINGDGFDDFFIGTQSDHESTDTSTGMSGSVGNGYLIYGGMRHETTGASYRLNNIAGSSTWVAYLHSVQYGIGVESVAARVGDVTGNGLDDLVITASRGEDTRTSGEIAGGMVYVVEGCSP